MDRLPCAFIRPLVLSATGLVLFGCSDTQSPQVASCSRETRALADSASVAQTPSPQVDQDVVALPYQVIPAVFQFTPPPLPQRSSSTPPVRLLPPTQNPVRMIEQPRVRPPFSLRDGSTENSIRGAIPGAMAQEQAEPALPSPSPSPRPPIFAPPAISSGSGEPSYSGRDEPSIRRIPAATAEPWKDDGTWTEGREPPNDAELHGLEVDEDQQAGAGTGNESQPPEMPREYPRQSRFTPVLPHEFDEEDPPAGPRAEEELEDDQSDSDLELTPPQVLERLPPTDDLKAEGNRAADMSEYVGPPINSHGAAGEVDEAMQHRFGGAARGTAIDSAGQQGTWSPVAIPMSPPQPLRRREMPAPQRILRGGPNPAVAAVGRRADELTRQAYALAERGAFYSARSELIQALRLVSQALDTEAGVQTHSQSLANGLRALRCADDFIPKGSRLEADLDIRRIVVTHKLPIVDDTELDSMSTLAVLQRYYTYAQQELADACGNEPAASRALFGLGKIYNVLGSQSVSNEKMHGPKAMAFHQAALSVDPGNYQAANELGVLLARYGQLSDARRVLLHSILIRPQAETWHNLAVVHEQLGETDLARRAQYEYRLATDRAGTTAGREELHQTNVRWVQPEEFAAMPSDDGFTMPATPTLAPPGRAPAAQRPRGGLPR